VNGVSDIVLRDTIAQTTELVSMGAAGQANASSDSPAISGDGNCIAFQTNADNLVTMPPGTDHSRVVSRALRGDCPFGPVAAAPPPPAADTTAPVISGLRLAPTRFRAGARVQAARRGRTAIGSRLRFSLSEAGRVRIRVGARLPGRRVGKRCVARRPGAKGRACIRFVRKGTLSAPGKLGANTVAVTGRVARKLLVRGRYRGTITAVDAAGNRSAPRTFTFTILPTVATRKKP
jgi:hypothetical protein